MELLIAVLALFFLVIYLVYKVMQLQERIDIFDKWADWIEDELLHAERELVFKLDIGDDSNGEGKD
jgi:uncharacterized protein YoxC